MDKQEYIAVGKIEGQLAIPSNGLVLPTLQSRYGDKASGPASLSYSRTGDRIRPLLCQQFEVFELYSPSIRGSLSLNYSAGVWHNKDLAVQLDQLPKETTDGKGNVVTTQTPNIHLNRQIVTLGISKYCVIGHLNATVIYEVIGDGLDSARGHIKEKTNSYDEVIELVSPNHKGRLAKEAEAKGATAQETVDELVDRLIPGIIKWLEVSH